MRVSGFGKKSKITGVATIIGLGPLVRSSNRRGRICSFPYLSLCSTLRIPSCPLLASPGDEDGELHCKDPGVTCQS